MSYRFTTPMTCQVCGQVLPTKATLEPHRSLPDNPPWPASPCPGTRKRPYEVETSTLQLSIKEAKERIRKLSVEIRRTDANLMPVIWTYKDRFKRSARNHPTEHGTTTVEVMPETWQKEYKQFLATRPIGANTHVTYDELKSAALKEMRADLARLEAYLATQQQRFAKWRPTHQRVGPQTWVLLPQK